MLFQTNVFSQRLVKDINVQSESSELENIVEFNGYSIMVVNDGIHGDCLWKTDGTTAGTSFIVDVSPACEDCAINGIYKINDSTLLFFAEIDNNTEALFKTDGTADGTEKLKNVRIDEEAYVSNGILYFSGRDNNNGYELWRSDATTAGTILLKEINTSSSSSNPEYFLEFNNEIYFAANDGINGTELWKTDGSEAGTQMIKNINSSSSSYPFLFYIFNNELYFMANDGINGQELWKTDGTEAGTHLFKDINPGTGSSFAYSHIIFNNKIYFPATNGTDGNELWVSDGTEAGTVLLKDINSGNGNSNPSSFVIIDSSLFFVATTDTYGQELWKTNGTDTGTIMVKDIATGSDGADIYGLQIYNNKLIFYASTTHDHLWITDGTETGTFDLQTAQQELSGDFIVIQNTIFFEAKDNSTNVSALWKSDGTTNGTVLVKNINPNNNCQLFFISQTNNNILFWADDGIFGWELWKTDGSEEGTKLVKDINFATKSSSPKYITAVNGKIFFTASPTLSSSKDKGGDGLINNLFVTDGTETGTIILKGDTITDIRDITNLNGTVFFCAKSEDYQYELWKSDGTEAGTVLVKDINPGASSSSMPDKFFVFNNKLYFRANDITHGVEIWVTDGTEAGTFILKDINPNTGSSNVDYYTIFNNELYFKANDGTSNGLWKTDGTEAGTVLVKHLYINSLITFNNAIYLSAYTSSNGTELWKSDGTDAGTVMVKDIYTGTYSSSPQNFTISNGSLFFTAKTANYNVELWKTDGTDAGTVMIKDINPGNNSSYPSFLTDVNGTLFFNAFTADNGQELWKSDGTDTGTVIIKDNVNGYSYPEQITNANGTAYYVADNDNTHGAELWKSDGTAAGTELVMDIYKGYENSDIDNLIFDGTQLYFSANNLLNGKELWTYTPGLLYPVINSQPSDVSICAGSNAIFSISASNVATYQWQVNDGNGFVDISNNSIYSGATTDSLLITSPTGNYYGYQYKCIAQNTGGNITSSNAYLYVDNNTIANAGIDAENLCGLEYSLSANTPESYETGVWTLTSGGNGTFDNDSLNSATFTADADNTYILTWTISNGSCQSSDNVQITLAEDNEAPTMTCIDNKTVTANAFHYYVVNNTEFDPTNISDNCGIDSTVNDFNNTNTLANAQLSEGMHLIKWTTVDNNGNDTICSYTITVNPYGTEIYNVSSDNISIFPNPTFGIVNINTSFNNYTLEITDVTGKKLLSENNVKTIDMSEFVSGIYFIKINTDDKIYVQKIIKK